MSKEIKIKDLSMIIVQAIEDEPFFSKEVLIPRIKGLITGFRLKMDSINYKSIENPSKTAQLIRSNQLYVEEKKFWKEKVKNFATEEQMKSFYKELDEMHE